MENADDVAVGVVVENKQNVENGISILNLLWSTIIYVLFVLFFILLNPHLNMLQNRLYELVFANKKLNEIIKYTKPKQTDSEHSMADILQLTANENGSNHIGNGVLSTSQRSLSSSQLMQSAPRWSKLLFFYVFVSIQFIGISSYFILTIFRSQ